MVSAHFKSFVKQNWQILSVLVLASAAALWFAASMILDVVYFNDPRHMDEPLRGWMTPKYVAMSFDLPRPVIAEIFQLPDDGKKGLRMHDISRDLGLSMPELNDRVREAAHAYREGTK